MVNRNCYACRNYFTECQERHEKKELLWAKHKEGWFWWGRVAKSKPGQWVRICRWCRDDLASCVNRA